MTPEVGTGQFKFFPFLSNYHPPPIDIGVDGVRHIVRDGGVVVAYKLDGRMDSLVQQMLD